MNELSKKLEQLLEYYDEKQQRKYHIQTFINLCNKLDEDVDEEIAILINESSSLLNELKNYDKSISKEYKKSFAKLQKVVRQKLGLTEKGQIKSQYMAMGIALGVAFGGAFVATNPALIGVGIPIGLAIGLAIGEKKEKEAVAQGKVY